MNIEHAIQRLQRTMDEYGPLKLVHGNRHNDQIKEVQPSDFDVISPFENVDDPVMLIVNTQEMNLNAASKFITKGHVVNAVQWRYQEHLERVGHKPGQYIPATKDPLTGVQFEYHCNPNERPTSMLYTEVGRPGQQVYDGNWIVTIPGKGQRVMTQQDFEFFYNKI